jgi:hypothetical protein
MTLSTDQRRAIWERDRGICGICGEPVDWADLDIDHTVPRMVGGSDALENLRASHHLCNMNRGVKDRRQHGIGPGRPGANPDHRLIMLLDARTAQRLDALAAKFEWSRSTVIRQAVKMAAEQAGLEPKAAHTPTPPVSEEE